MGYKILFLGILVVTFVHINAQTAVTAEASAGATNEKEIENSETSSTKAQESESDSSSKSSAESENSEDKIENSDNSQDKIENSDSSQDKIENSDSSQDKTEDSDSSEDKTEDSDSSEDKTESSDDSEDKTDSSDSSQDDIENSHSFPERKFTTLMRESLVFMKPNHGQDDDGHFSGFIDNFPPLQIRRQGDVNPLFNEKETDLTYDDSQQNRSPLNLPPPLPRNNNDQGNNDNTQFLHLTQGGYERPFLAQSDRQQTNVVRPQQLVETKDKIPTATNSQDNSGVSGANSQSPYPSSYQPSPQFGFGQGPILQSPYSSYGGFSPNTFQSRPLNSQFSDGLSDFTPNFQTQFNPSSGFGVHSHFSQAPDNPFFQAPQRNALPTSPVLISPFGQSQGVFMNPHQSRSPQFQTSSFAGFDNIDDSSRPDITTYFRNPVATLQRPSSPLNFYGNNPAPISSAFNNPSLSLISNFPSADFGTPFSPNIQRSPAINPRVPARSAVISQQDQRIPEESAEDGAKNTNPALGQPNIENPRSIPFGARLSPEIERQRNVYIRYPMSEAGYATEENFPAENATRSDSVSSDPVLRRFRLFFPHQGRPQYPVTSNRDPYREALRSLQNPPREDSNNESNNTNEINSPFFPNDPLQFGYPEVQNTPIGRYPIGNQIASRYPNGRFYPGAARGDPRSPLNILDPFHDNRYDYLNSQRERDDGLSNETPNCARQNNASLCFEDADYPRNQVRYALNSDALFADRFMHPDPTVSEFVFVEKNGTAVRENEDNYICKTDIKYGNLRRAKNIQGNWRVIVNMDEASDSQRKFIHPLRLEVCRGAGEPCPLTNIRVKTACVQKFAVMSLPSWSPNKGVHLDSYRLPIACSCQIMEETAA